MSLFVDEIILYIENLKVSTKKKTFKVVKEFSNVAGYKINAQKSAAFLFQN